MSLPFSRSMHSLSADRYRLARLGLILSILLVFAMLTWFFFARISLYEKSTSIELTAENRLLAEFPQESLDQIRPGQNGILSLSDPAGDTPITANVVVYGLDESSGKIEFVLNSDLALATLTPGNLAGSVSIQVASIAPVDLVLQAVSSGQSSSLGSGESSRE